MKTYIYCLFDKNEILLYIGKTKNLLKIREAQHKKRLNKEISIFELDYIDDNEWKFWEKHYISLFRSWGFKLENKNKGGGGLSSHTEESLQKMRGKQHPGTSNKLKGRSRPDVSKRLKGKNLNNITKQKISKNKKGHICYQDPKRIEKIINSNKQHYILNSERNQKISNKLKGRKINWSKTKPIFQYDLEGNFIKEWISATEAGKYLNKPSSAISECCSNKRKSAYKYIWKYKSLASKI